MKLRVGQSLVSAVDDTSVILTRAPAGETSLTCGGVEMHVKGSVAPSASADPAQMNGTLLGKRYVDADGAVEALCTKAGPGSLAVDGKPLTVGASKALPSTD